MVDEVPVVDRILLSLYRKIPKNIDTTTFRSTVKTGNSKCGSTLAANKNLNEKPMLITQIIYFYFNSP